MITRCLSVIPSCSQSLMNNQSRSITSLPTFKLYSFRRRLAEKISNRYDPKRVEEIGPDLACLEWLMECGATSVEMSDGQKLTRIREMKQYVEHAMKGEISTNKPPIQPGDLAYEKMWPNAPFTHIINVDASDSAVANEGFSYLKDVRRIRQLKLNFCDFFGDEALKFLAQGRPAETLQDLEIVLNPCLTDGSIYWLQKMKALRRAHFYFLPYVSHRQGFVRQLKLTLPKCKVTFPEVTEIGYGYQK